MGSVSAMASVDRVLKKHGKEIVEKYTPASPLIKKVVAENNVYSIQIHYLLVDGTWLEGPSIDIDTLAEEYPDCEVGY